MGGGELAGCCGESSTCEPARSMKIDFDFDWGRSVAGCGDLSLQSLKAVKGSGGGEGGLLCDGIEVQYYTYGTVLNCRCRRRSTCRLCLYSYPVK